MIELIKNYLENRNFQSAGKYLPRLKKIGETIKDREICSWYFMFQAWIHLEKDRRLAAERSVVHAHRTIKRNDRNYPDLLLLEARLTAGKQEPRAVIDKFKKAIGIYSPETHQHSINCALYHFAEFLIKAGRSKTARAMLHDALMYFVRIGNEPFTKKIRKLIG